jgi:hypothetical protein
VHYLEVRAKTGCVCWAAPEKKRAQRIPRISGAELYTREKEMCRPTLGLRFA